LRFVRYAHAFLAPACAANTLNATPRAACARSTTRSGFTAWVPHTGCRTASAYYTLTCTHHSYSRLCTRHLGHCARAPAHASLTCLPPLLHAPHLHTAARAAALHTHRHTPPLLCTATHLTSHLPHCSLPAHTPALHAHTHCAATLTALHTTCYCHLPRTHHLPACPAHPPCHPRLHAHCTPGLTATAPARAPARLTAAHCHTAPSPLPALHTLPHLPHLCTHCHTTSCLPLSHHHRGLPQPYTHTTHTHTHTTLPPHTFFYTRTHTLRTHLPTHGHTLPLDTPFLHSHHTHLTTLTLPHHTPAHRCTTSLHLPWVLLQNFPPPRIPFPLPHTPPPLSLPLHHPLHTPYSNSCLHASSCTPCTFSCGHFRLAWVSPAAPHGFCSLHPGTACPWAGTPTPTWETAHLHCIRRPQLPGHHSHRTHLPGMDGQAGSCPTHPSPTFPWTTRAGRTTGIWTYLLLPGLAGWKTPGRFRTTTPLSRVCGARLAVTRHYSLAEKTQRLMPPPAMDACQNRAPAPSRIGTSPFYRQPQLHYPSLHDRDLDPINITAYTPNLPPTPCFLEEHTRDLPTPLPHTCCLACYWPHSVEFPLPTVLYSPFTPQAPHPTGAAGPTRLHAALYHARTGAAAGKRDQYLRAFIFSTLNRGTGCVGYRKTTLASFARYHYLLRSSVCTASARTLYQLVYAYTNHGSFMRRATYKSTRGSPAGRCCTAACRQRRFTAVVHRTGHALSRAVRTPFCRWTRSVPLLPRCAPGKYDAPPRQPHSRERVTPQTRSAARMTPTVTTLPAPLPGAGWRAGERAPPPLPCPPARTARRAGWAHLLYHHHHHTPHRHTTTRPPRASVWWHTNAPLGIGFNDGLTRQNAARLPSGICYSYFAVAMKRTHICYLFAALVAFLTRCLRAGVYPAAVALLPHTGFASCYHRANARYTPARRLPT